MPVNLGTAYAEIKLKTDNFSSGIKQASGQLDEFKNKAGLVADGFTAAGATMTKAGSTLTKSVTVPLMGVATAAVKTTATFDESMSKVQALSGATGENFDSLRDKAIEMGAKTAFSASEAADAFGYMALAGWKTGDMLNGIEGILNLAAASQMDLAEASDMVTDYLTAFGLEAEHAGVMADQLAYAQANSNSTTRQFGEAFKNSAAQMHTAGQTMETTVALLEAMANQGLKGSEAGTALSATIRDLTQKMYTYSDANEAAQAAADGFKSVTGDMNDVIGVATIEIGNMLVPVSDAQGNFRNLIDIMADVEKATEGLGSAEKSQALLSTFTARSIKAVSMSLTEGTDNIKNYEKALYDVDGTAKEMSETMLKNLNGQLTILKSTIETLLIQIGDLLMPTISKVVEKIRQLVLYFTGLDEEQKKQILRWAGIAAAIGPALLVFGKVLTGIGSLIKTGSALLTWSTNIAKAFGLISSGASGITAGLSALASAAAPILAVVAAVAALGVAFKALYDQNGAFKESVDNLSASLKNSLQGALDGLKSAIDFIIESMKPVIETFKNSFDLSAVDEAMSKLVDSLGRVIEAVKPIAKFIGEVLLGVLAVKVVPILLTIIGAINGILKAVSPLIDTITAIIDVVTDIANIVTGLIEGIITGDFTKLQTALSNLGDDLLRVVTGLIDTIVALITGFFEGIFVTIESFTGGMLTKIGNFFANLWNSIVTFFTVTVPEAFDTFVHKIIPNFIENVSQWFEQLPYNIGYALGAAIVTVSEWGANLVERAKTDIPLFIESVISYIWELPDKFQTWLSEVITKVAVWGKDLVYNGKTTAKSFLDGIVEFIKQVPEKIWAFMQEIPNKVLSIRTELYNAGVSILNSLWDGMKAVWESISDWFNGIFEKIGDFVQGIKDGMAEASDASKGASEGSHADGLAYVPYNGYKATLHEGERVLTRNEAQNYGTGSRGSYVFNFYSPKELDPYEANKLLINTMRKMEEGFVI